MNLSNHLREFKFHRVYELVSIIDTEANYEEFFNYNEKIFKECSTKYSKFTLLHLYIVTRALNHYGLFLRKHGDLYDEDEYDDLNSLFKTYSVQYLPKKKKKGERTYDWYCRNHDQFELLFLAMSFEVFHILFHNRNFLLTFNELVVRTVRKTKYRKSELTKKGTLKRKSIPSWTKKAVFHRDKGICVFCSRDLTNLFHTLSEKNFDHIVPLDKYGTNDPCNLQLTCATCNKSKSNRESSTSNKYAPWW